MLIKSWFKNIDSSEDPFLWATKENSEATGKCHLFTFFSMTTSLYALLSDEQEIRFRKFTRQGDPNKKGTKAESKLNSQERKHSKVFFIQIFSDKTVILLEKALIVIVEDVNALKT